MPQVDRYRERLVAGLSISDLTGSSERLAVAEGVSRLLTEDGLGGDPMLLRALVDELAGFGPLEPLLHDATVSEIMVNAPDSVWIEVRGRLQESSVRFRDGEHVRVILERLLNGTGRSIDEASPLVDARLADGSRLNAVLPPVSPASPLLTIRRPPRGRLSLGDLMAQGSVDGPVAAFLHAAVLGRLNVLVTGAAGAGKTTLLAALAALAPRGERLVTIEDTAELVIDHPHVVGQECRAARTPGQRDITLRDLVRNSLRMRPDRLIVGEVRGPEAADMIVAMNTGHAGSMATVHASGATDGISRLEAMLALAWPALHVGVLQRWIASAVDVIVHCERDSEGVRFIRTVAAVDDRGGRAVARDVLSRDHHDVVSRVSAAEPPRRCLERMAGRGVRYPARLLGGTAA